MLDFVSPEHLIKTKILELFANNPNCVIYKLGFLNNWENEPLWQVLIKKSLK